MDVELEIDLSKPFNLLTELGNFGLDRELSLRDPATKAAFGAHVAAAVDQALSDPVLLHGRRTEAMFEALLVSLGEFRLLKAEDAGRVFPAEQFRVPDFRVVLKCGTQWLVEVKNAYVDGPSQQRRRFMNQDYREALEAYAASTGAELKLAVFWAKWSIWTLVSPSRFADAEGNVVLDMEAAMAASELAWLGDRMIGTRPPLRLRLSMDAAKTGPIGPDGMTQVVIESAALFCDKAQIIDPVEQQIAWIFMQHGEWPSSEAEAIIEEDRLVAIEFRWEPKERLNNGFEMIGTLSRMFSRYYAEQTLKNREVIQVTAPLRPGWFTPLVSSDYESRALPLWRFQVQPVKAESGRA
jgi:hypothetical protein